MISEQGSGATPSVPNAEPVNSTSTTDQPYYEYQSNAAETSTSYQGTKVDDYEDTKRHASKLQEKARIFIENHGGTAVIVFFASLIVLVTAIIDVRKSKKGVVRGKVLAGYRFAVFVGIFSMLLSGVYAYSTRKPIVDQNVRFIMVCALAVVWTVAVLWLTFGPTYQTTGNAYFAIWAAFLLTMQLFSAETAMLAGLFTQFRAFGWQLGSLLLLSIILVIACSANCSDTNGCNSEPLFGLIIGLASAIFAVCVFYFVEKLPQTVRIGLFGVFTALWVIVAFLLTFRSPFETTGNGYFAAWGGLIAMTLLMTRVLNLGGDGTMDHGSSNNNNVV